MMGALQKGKYKCGGSYMKMHCVRSKQTQKGRYEYQADGVVEIQGYSYPIKAGSVISPDINLLEIQTYKGEHCVLQYIPKRSEWIVNADNESVIIKKFDGIVADVIIIKKDKDGKKTKRSMAVYYHDLLYGLTHQLLKLMNVS